MSNKLAITKASGYASAVIKNGTVYLTSGGKR